MVVSKVAWVFAHRTLSIGQSAQKLQAGLQTNKCSREETVSGDTGFQTESYDFFLFGAAASFFFFCIRNGLINTGQRGFGDKLKGRRIREDYRRNPEEYKIHQHHGINKKEELHHHQGGNSDDGSSTRSGLRGKKDQEEQRPRP
jgi:hypothetical protein